MTGTKRGDTSITRGCMLTSVKTCRSVACNNDVLADTFVSGREGCEGMSYKPPICNETRGKLPLAPGFSLCPKGFYSRLQHRKTAIE